MSFSDAFEAALLDHYFLNVAHANVGDATGLPAAATVGNFYFALHTADPGETGDQTTSEATFTSYARTAVPRGGSGFTRSGTNPTQIANVATVTFPTCTGGTNTCTHFSLGLKSSGASQIIYSGPLTNQVVVALGNPVATFAPGAFVGTVD
jgi:hypothetical protein